MESFNLNVCSIYTTLNRPWSSNATSVIPVFQNIDFLKKEIPRRLKLEWKGLKFSAKIVPLKKLKCFKILVALHSNFFFNFVQVSTYISQTSTVNLNNFEKLRLMKLKHSTWKEYFCPYAIYEWLVLWKYACQNIICKWC